MRLQRPIWSDINLHGTTKRPKECEWKHGPGLDSCTGLKSRERILDRGVLLMEAHTY